MLFLIVVRSKLRDRFHGHALALGGVNGNVIALVGQTFNRELLYLGRANRGLTVPVILTLVITALPFVQDARLLRFCDLLP